MRTPVFRVTSDDPSDYDYPMAVSLPQLRDADGYDTYETARTLPVGGSLVVGDEDETRFTVTRIR